MPKRTRPGPPPLDLRVRCGKETHHIQWNRGRLQFGNHPSQDLRLLDALKVPCRCGEILQAIRSMAWRKSTILPAALRRALIHHLAHRDTHRYCTGTLLSPDTLWQTTRATIRQQALARRFRSLTEALSAQGLITSIRPDSVNGRPVVVLSAGSFDPSTPGPPLGRHTDGEWQLLPTAIADAAHATTPDGSPHEFWAAQNTCRPCNHTFRVTAEYPNGMVRHASTTKHLQAVQCGLPAVFGPNSLHPRPPPEPHRTSECRPVSKCHNRCTQHAHCALCIRDLGCDASTFDLEDAWRPPQPAPAPAHTEAGPSAKTITRSASSL
jgi:hypothetical protein